MTPEIMLIQKQQQQHDSSANSVQAQTTSIKQLQTELKRSSRLRRTGLPPPPLPPLHTVNKRKSTSVIIENAVVKTESGGVVAKRRRTESDSKSNVIVMEDLRVNVSESIETELEMSQDERNGEEKADEQDEQRIKELRRIEKFLLQVSFLELKIN